MAKYDPVRAFLRASGQERVTLTFSEIDRLVPGGLPRSAYEYQAWWANEREPRTHVQKHAWYAAGYEVDRLDLGARTVTFVRNRVPARL